MSSRIYLRAFRAIRRLAALVLWAWAIPVSSQIILIYPPPPRPIPPPYPIEPAPPQSAPVFEFKEMEIDAHAKDQAAEVQITQVVTNPGETPLEAQIVFPLPEDAAVGNLVLMVDGKEMAGKLLDKDQARKEYDEIVKKQRDPALLEYVGRGLYRTNVFPIPAKADRKVTLRYTQLLTKDRDRIAWSLPLFGSDASAIPKSVKLRVRMQTTEELKAVYAPAHDLTIDRPGTNEAKLEFSSNDPRQIADFSSQNSMPLYFVTANSKIGATVMSWKPSGSEDGYCLVLASPGLRQPQEDPIPKTVIFVLDRSGSMTGKKIEQAQAALKFVLNNLHDGDTFNIVAYDDRVESYKPELQGVNGASRTAALQYVDDIRPGGSTNISEALTKSLALVTDRERPSYILFLTDGLPTAGETRELAIAELVSKANANGARILVWGVGDDVNARLLDRISGANGGASDYVRPSENVEAGVSRVFSRMTDPVLTSPTLSLQGVTWNRIYPQRLPDFFAGGQMVVVGRYARAGKGTLKLSGMIGKEREESLFPLELDDASSGTQTEFVARLWATRRIGDLIDQLDLKGQNKELIDEVVALSKEFGIITPYTSFLAREDVALADVFALQSRAEANLGNLTMESGRTGTAQRAYKYQMNSAASVAKSAAEAPAMDKDMWNTLGNAPSAQPAGGGVASSSPAAPVLDESQANRLVKRLGAKTFFWKQNRWEDAALSSEQSTAKPQEIRQFSDEWFALSNRLSAEENRYLTLREPALINIRGEVYMINTAM